MLRAAVEAAPADDRILLNYGAALLLADRPAAAIVPLAAAATVQRDTVRRARALLMLTKALRQANGDEAEATRHYRAARSLLDRADWERRDMLQRAAKADGRREIAPGTEVERWKAADQMSLDELIDSTGSW